MAFKSNCGLLLRTEVKLRFFCPIIEAQIVFKVFLALTISQLVIELIEL